MRGVLTVGALLLLCAWANPVHAWMWEVGDEELAEITGEGFSSFTLDDYGVARAYFNVNVTTFTEIESLKMGYYTRAGVDGWDQDWESVSLGSASQDLTIKGVYLEASFSNIDDADNRQLNYVKVGTPSMTGTISATFNSFSGQITLLNGTDYVNGYRQALGTRVITCNNSEFSIKVDATDGWWVYLNNATVN